MQNNEKMNYNEAMEYLQQDERNRVVYNDNYDDIIKLERDVLYMKVNMFNFDENDKIIDRGHRWEPIQTFTFFSEDDSFIKCINVDSDEMSFEEAIEYLKDDVKNIVVRKNRMFDDIFKIENDELYAKTVSNKKWKKISFSNPFLKKSLFNIFEE